MDSSFRPHPKTELFVLTDMRKKYFASLNALGGFTTW